jgi:hypothetical protein
VTTLLKSLQASAGLVEELPDYLNPSRQVPD